MSNAWVVFDKKTGALLSIEWNKPENNVNVLGISQEIAEKFILGDLRFVDYRIVEIDGELELLRLDDIRTPQIFWSLNQLDQVKNDLDIKIQKNKISIFVKNMPDVAYMFATLKDDPTWLISSWNLKNLPNKNNKIHINFKHANTYSFFVSKTDEV